MPVDVEPPNGTGKVMARLSVQPGGSDRNSARRVPAISIGMPVYNEERNLRRALDSVLAQEFQDFEVVLIDDASADDTPAICEEYALKDSRIKYSRNKRNLGEVGNSNRVFNLSRAKYFMWASAKDVRDRGFVAECVAVLEKHPAANLCYPEVFLADWTGGKLRTTPPRPDPQDVVRSIFSRFLGQLGFTQLQDTHGLPPAVRLLSMYWKIVRPNIYGVIRSDELRKTRLYMNFVGCDLVLLAELSLLGEFILIPKPMHYRNVGNKPDPPHSYKVLRSVLNRLDARNRGRSIWLPNWGLVSESVIAVWRGRISKAQKMVLSCLVVIRFFDGMMYDLYRAARFGPVKP